jgi:Pyruvate/2-oxoacid:ferredoxin oxidoreductase delta subunit
MPIRDQATLRIVLYEGPDVAPLSAPDRYDLLARLLDGGYAVTRVTGQGEVARHDRGSVVVLGRFAQNPPADGNDEHGTAVRFENIDGLDATAASARVDAERDRVQAARHGEWKPWFPVIDYDRCTNCMQCLSFCLFGVYGVDAGQKIQVQTSDNCKTNCPACSRVCPEAAIMFPKYKAGPINGDVVSAADLNREKMKIDISALLGGDVYSLLRERSDKAKSRFSKERDSDKALKERQKCLTKLAQSGDIPPEVLMSLPSPDEIARRADEAKAKAQAALAAQPPNPSP